MTREELQEKISELSNLIQRANHGYYDLNTPIMEDEEYDSLRREILELDKKWTELLSEECNCKQSAGNKKDFAENYVCLDIETTINKKLPGSGKICI